MKTDKNDLDKITLSYKDGKTKKITKGMVLTLDEENGEAHMNMEFADMSGKDLVDIVYGFMQFASESGILGKIVEEESE